MDKRSVERGDPPSSFLGQHSVETRSVQTGNKALPGVSDAGTIAPLSQTVESLKEPGAANRHLRLRQLCTRGVLFRTQGAGRVLEQADTNHFNDMLLQIQMARNRVLAEATEKQTKLATDIESWRHELAQEERKIQENLINVRKMREEVEQTATKCRELIQTMSQNADEEFVILET